MCVIFDIHIIFQGATQVVAGDKTIKLISFIGKCESAYFVGRVLPGGTDLQLLEENDSGTVSARYILEGIDSTGNPCKVFITNEGVIDEAGEMKTTPRVVTDSEVLSWLHDAELQCKFVTKEDGFHVMIYAEALKG